MLALIEQAQPDLIVITGDYLNLSYVDDPTARAEVRKVLAELHAPYGVYATLGSPPVDPRRTTPSLFDGLSSKFQKIYKIISIDSDIEKYILKIKNISSEDLHGVTVRVTGLKEGIFETAPSLTGFNKWKKGEEKEIIYETKQDISALISIITDNSQRNIRIQSAVSSEFF